MVDEMWFASTGVFRAKPVLNQGLKNTPTVFAVVPPIDAFTLGVRLKVSEVGAEAPVHV